MFNICAHCSDNVCVFQAVVSCGVSCDHPAEAVDTCLSLFSTECPLLLLSAAVKLLFILSAIFSFSLIAVLNVLVIFLSYLVNLILFCFSLVLFD